MRQRGFRGSNIATPRPLRMSVVTVDNDSYSESFDLFGCNCRFRRRGFVFRS